MIIGCKKGCLCEDVNKEYCCLECSNFNDCTEPCMFLLNGKINKKYVAEICKYAIKVNS